MTSTGDIGAFQVGNGDIGAFQADAAAPAVLGTATQSIQTLTQSANGWVLTLTSTAGGSVLDSCGRVDIEHRWPRVNSDYRQGVLLQHVRNGDIGNRTLRTFTLTWPHASQSLAHSIGQHYATNAHEWFAVNLPGETVTCIYLDRPSLNYTTATDASVTVRLEESLATD